MIDNEYIKKYPHIEGFYTCSKCGRRVTSAYIDENKLPICYDCKDVDKQTSSGGINMFEEAKVVTSKFLQLRDKLNNAIRDNRGYDTNPMRASGTSEQSCNIYELQKAFGELCELLHELVVGK